MSAGSVMVVADTPKPLAICDRSGAGLSILDPIKTFFSTAFPLKRIAASLTALYSRLLQTIMVTGMLYRAAVQRAWLEMIKVPSPTKNDYLAFRLG